MLQPCLLYLEVISLVPRTVKCSHSRPLSAIAHLPLPFGRVKSVPFRSLTKLCAFTAIAAQPDGDTVRLREFARKTFRLRSAAAATAGTPSRRLLALRKSVRRWFHHCRMCPYAPLLSAPQLSAITQCDVTRVHQVVFFSAALPAVTAAAALANLLELRGDANKILYLFRRPRFQGANGIGRWKGIIEVRSTHLPSAAIAICFVHGHHLHMCETTTCTHLHVYKASADDRPSVLGQSLCVIALVVNALLVVYTSNELRDLVIIPVTKTPQSA